MNKNSSIIQGNGILSTHLTFVILCFNMLVKGGFRLSANWVSKCLVDVRLVFLLLVFFICCFLNGSVEQTLKHILATCFSPVCLKAWVACLALGY